MSAREDEMELEPTPEVAAVWVPIFDLKPWTARPMHTHTTPPPPASGGGNRG